MIAPPPMPNRPARMPVTTPPMTIAKASQASSPSGMPGIIGCSGENLSGRDMRQLCARVHDEAQRVAQDRNAGARLDGVRRDVAAERARAGHALEQAEDVPGHRMQPRAARKLALEVREKRLEH